jgi:RNA polymerase sigma-70 factor (ECF subfamily)
MKTKIILCLTAMLCGAIPGRAAEVSLESAPPVVVKTEPVAGATNVDPRTSEIVVQFSKPMQDGSWSWSTWGEENFPEMVGQPKYAADGRTCVLKVKLQPGKFYATWLNSDKFKNFTDTAGRSAVPYLLTFRTAEATAAPTAAAAPLSPLPAVEQLPGRLIFHGRYRHRSRGNDIDTPSQLWIKESPGGGLSVLADVPFMGAKELAVSDQTKRFVRFQSRGNSGYELDLELKDGAVNLSRRGVRQDVDGKELSVPAGAWFDPNTRPDSYVAANLLLRGFAVGVGETKEFRVYDWDNSGEGLADYTIRLQHAGKEKVEVPAGTFEANHFGLTQVTSADTWFKKRAGHVTDFWVLDNRVIVRVLRHLEPYEMVLLDYAFPTQSLPGTVAPGKPVEGTAAADSGERDISAAAADTTIKLLNDDQRAVLEWTDRQFRSFFDSRTFEGWPDEERSALETKLIDALNGPRSTEYYQAINSLTAMRSAKALPRLREIASERVDRNNRDRWMAIRALGMIGDKADVPDLIHLVYHGNVNTRWWAQISLVRITGKNFAKDWNAWGKWWNDQNGQPSYKPEIIRWWNGQPEPEKLAESLEESDQKFLESLRGKSAAAPAPGSSTDLAARLRTATPVMEGIREAWSAAVAALQSEDARNALASLQTLAPRIQKFRDAMKGTPLEAGTAESLKTLGPLIDALEKGNLEAARTALEPMLALGKKMETQVKAITDESPSPRPESAPASAPQIQPEREN